MRTHSLLDLVSDLLQVVKLESNSPRKREPVDLAGIIRNTLELLKGQGNGKDLAFQLYLPDTLPLIEADPAEMEQLFTNLISNAIKYNVEHGRVIVMAQPKSQHLCIKVTDTGVGIDKEDLPHIFDKFFRVSNPETRYVTGTGLGLSIVKRIIESHSGHIDVKSEEHKGTTFTVKLPLK
jgi:two-component system, OmpR family, phosphate regulon sensor histidine kinase PhoR